MLKKILVIGSNSFSGNNFINYCLNKKLLTLESIKSIKSNNSIDKCSFSDDSSVDSDIYNPNIKNLYQESIFKC